MCKYNITYLFMSSNKGCLYFPLYLYKNFLKNISLKNDFSLIYLKNETNKNPPKIYDYRLCTRLIHNPLF